MVAIRGEQTSLTPKASGGDLKRRGLFAMGAALLGAAATKLAAPTNVEAAAGGPVILGQDNDAGGARTKITSNVVGDNAVVFETNQNGGNALVGVNTGNGGGLVGSVQGTGTALAGISQKGIGLSGTSFATTGTDFAGVSGFSQIGFGVRGGTGANSTANPPQTGSGVLGEGGANAPGVLGTSIGGIGVKGVSTSSFAGQFDGPVRVNGNFEATGTKSAVITGQGGSLVKVYCLESPESYFEDFGEAIVRDGKAEVQLRSDFLAIVNPQGYQVFLTDYANLGGAYVERGPSSFRIVSPSGQGGTVGYRVVARRADVEAARLAPVSAREGAPGLHTPRAVPAPAPLPAVNNSAR